MFFPISDDDSKLRRTAWITILFIIINIGVFIYQESNTAFTSGYSAIPKEITTNTDLIGTAYEDIRGKKQPIPQAPGPVPIFLTLFTAMFMHGSWMHLGSNMLFLWVFGDNVELRFGTFRFILFYIISGLIASMTHILLDPNSVIPSLGASGAIFGVLGAYLVMFPRNKVNNLLFFVKVISLPAFIVVGFFAVMNFVPFFAERIQDGSKTGGGVAYAAHIGGMIAGIVLGLAFRFTLDKEPDSVLYRNYRNDDKAKRIW